MRYALAHDSDSNKYRATSLSDKMRTFKTHLDKVGGDYSEAPCEHAWTVESGRSAVQCFFFCIQRQSGPRVGNLSGIVAGRLCSAAIQRSVGGRIEIRGKGGRAL